jgi:flagellar hook-associated protein 3 FlgL
MIRMLDPSADAFLASLNQICDRMERAQREMATGVRVATVSDDPDSISAILQTRADLELAQQIQANLGRVKAESDAAEQALQTSVRLVERVRSLGSQGVTGTATAESRKSLGDEVGSILEQLVGIMRTSVEGRYIFSGDADQVPPYTVDLTQATPVSVYAGGGVTRLIQHPNGARFSVARTARDIFDSANASENVFNSLNSLRLALSSDDETEIRSALDNVSSALTFLNRQLAYYGTVQNKVQEASDFGSKLQLQLKTHLSSLQDADVAESILELSQAQLQQQAALKARSAVPRTSLFDYLD